MSFSRRIGGFRAADSRPWRRMQKSLKSPEYERLIALLVALRKKADIRQQALAKKLGNSWRAPFTTKDAPGNVTEIMAIQRSGSPFLGWPEA